MSFSKTVSVVAALASIFSVGLASWKISEDIKSSQTAPLEEKIQELEKKLEQPEQVQIAPESVTIPNPVISPQTINEQNTPIPPSLPSPTPSAPSAPPAPTQQ
jgi:hypothetical protein